MTILAILNELAATRSVNAKVAILERERSNDLLKAVFKAAYDPSINYYQKKIPEFQSSNEPSSNLDEVIVTVTNHLSTRSTSGNAAIRLLTILLESLPINDAEVLSRIIDRDLRCGTSDTLASRIWSGFVPVFDVMLCDKDISRIHYPAMIQLKCDGARVHAYFKNGQLTCFSRQGKEFQLHGALDTDAAKLMKDGETFDGELLVMIDGKVADRQTGNGHLNRASKNTITVEQAQQIVMVVWDIVDTSSSIEYKYRFEDLCNRKIQEDSKFQIVPYNLVRTEEEAMTFFHKQLSDGQEGAILKNLDSKWVPKRSKDLVKLKGIYSADLLVVGIEEGTGKYEGMLGALICETSDGLLNVNVGTGFSDEQRALPFDYWMGAIVEVLYNQVITSRGRETKSLFLPRLSVKRFDKSEANTLDELV